MDKLNMRTSDGVQENIAKIASLFPECITECKETLTGGVKRVIDFDKLRQLLSSEIVEGRDERYQFTWPDKRQAILSANSPINATLRPCRDESLDFDNTHNLYIEGDNLDVLKCLKETYLHRVKMIYIDPPYNTGNDYVYHDDFSSSAADYADRSGQYDDFGNRMVTNTESNGRFHTDWLNMIYPRLKVARDLLSDDGVVFVSIDENESHNLRKLLDEIFGSSNFISNIVWEKRYTRSNNSKRFTTLTEPILCYCKDITKVLSIKERRTEKSDSTYANPDNDPRGVWTSVSYVNPATKEQRPNLTYPLYNPITGLVVTHPTNAWKYERSTYEEHVKEKKLYWGKNGENSYPRLKKFLSEMDGGMVPVDLWNYRETGSTDLASKELECLIGRKLFDFPKPKDLIKRMASLVINGNEGKDSIIIDFFSGSATTAHAVMQLNAEDGGHRKFIMVQLPEPTDPKSEAYKAGYSTICEIGKERIRRAGAKIKADSPLTTLDLDTGFRVLKLDSSNMSDFFYAPAETKQDNLLDLIDNVKPDRSSEDLLFQVMLELGATLDSSIEKVEVDGKSIFRVDGDYLVACFDTDVTDDVVTAIAKMQPAYAVLRDTSMKDDATASNFEQIFKTFSPNTVTKIL